MKERQEIKSRIAHGNLTYNISKSFLFHLIPRGSNYKIESYSPCCYYQFGLWSFETFYTDILGLTIESEHYWKEQNWHKTDCSLSRTYGIELFSFLNLPTRISYPEAIGLHHLAFEVDSIDETRKDLDQKSGTHESVQTDEYTKKRFVFLNAPDGLPIINSFPHINTIPSRTPAFPIFIAALQSFILYFLIPSFQNIKSIFC